MVKKSTEVKDEMDISSAPIFFADQPAALMLGAHVSRITFGIEEPDDHDFPRPVVTIAMPTTALLQFVNDVKDALSAPNFKKQTITELLKAAKSIESGGNKTSPDEMVINQKARPRRLK